MEQERIPINENSQEDRAHPTRHEEKESKKFLFPGEQADRHPENEKTDAIAQMIWMSCHDTSNESQLKLSNGEVLVGRLYPSVLNAKQKDSPRTPLCNAG